MDGEAETVTMWRVTNSLVSVGCSAAFFSAVYLLCCVGWLRPKIERIFSKVPGGTNPAKLDTNVARFSNHVMSITHCIIEIPLSLYVLRQGELQRDHLYGFTKEGHLCVSIAAGYFLTDVLIMLIRQDEGPLMMLHGLVGFLTYSYSAFRDINQFYGGSFLLWEISTPFVHFRWFLSKTGKENSVAYTVNGLVMMAAFFGSRCFWGTYVTHQFWTDTGLELANPKVDGYPAHMIWGTRFSNLALLGLCYYWFYLMMSKAMSFLSKPKNQ